MEEVNCVICEQNNNESVCKKSTLGIQLNLVLCKDCGLGYLSPRWNKERYLTYYSEQYDKQYRPNLKNEKIEESVNNQNIILERFIGNNIEINNSKAILDIGSGTGKNLLVFKRVLPEIKCYAIEPSLTSQEILLHNNIDIVSDDVDSSWDEKYEGTFDIIIMRHVLEHFLNPLDVLKKVHKVLSQNGVLYIAVPNNLIEKRNKGWLRIAHTFYFNQFTLSSILNKASLKVKTISLKDEFSDLEIYAFVKKENFKVNSVKIENSYEIQKLAFERTLANEKHEKTIKKRFVLVIKKLIKKLK